MDTVTVSAKNYDDALTKALIELGTSSDNVRIEVIKEGSGGFFGFGAKPWTIKVSRKAGEEKLEVKAKEKAFPPKKEIIKEIKPEKKEIKTPDKTVDNHKPEEVRVRKIYTDDEIDAVIHKAEEFLAKVFEQMGLAINTETTYDNSINEMLILLVSKEDIGIVIGKRGQTLDALQYIVSLVVNKNAEGYIRVKLDTENYRERRRGKLESLAKSIAMKVKKTRKAVSLEPMNPYERRIIHSTLQGDHQIITRSDGDEPHRYVTILPRHNNRRNGYKRYDKNSVKMDN